MALKYYTGDKITGLSTDTKPTTIGNGATFYETNTKKIYIKVSGSWVEVNYQSALGFTPENVANKRTSFQSTPDDTHYPSEKLVKDNLDTKMTNPMTASGDIIYGGNNGAPTRLAKGTDGQVLTLSSGVPAWVSSGEGSGDVSGPEGATADNIAVFNGTTGKLIKDGGAKLSDKQDTLISGTNIKTINSQSLLGTGNLGNYLENIVEDTTPELGGNLDAKDKNIIGIGSAGYTQELDNGTKTASFTIDFSTDQKQKVTLTADTMTLTLDTTNVKVGNYILKIVNGGLATLTWASESGSIYWAGKTKPTLTSSGTDIVAFYFDGTNWYGMASLNFGTPS